MGSTALTIGSFDGVHAGHAALIDRAREHAGRDGRVVALAFDPHPRAALAPGTEPARLTTFAHRSALLREAGADEVNRLDPTPDLLAMSPQAFLEWVHDQHDPDWIVEGPDFRFGRARAGSVDDLRLLGHSLGIRADIVPPVQVTLRDQSVVRASSSLVRWLVANSRVRDAGYVLGRPHRMTGLVVEGDKRGRDLGYPTANLVAKEAPPADGVYACVATLPGSRTVPAAVNIGTRPTFSGVTHRVEAHLLLDTPAQEWSPIDGLPAYGWDLTLDFIGWVRDQARYPSPSALRDQLTRDCERVRTIVSPVLHTAHREPAA